MVVFWHSTIKILALEKQDVAGGRFDAGCPFVAEQKSISASCFVFVW